MSKFAFVSIHLACVFVIWSGISSAAVVVCLILYWVRMFGITAGYHRLLSHRSYKTSRVFQFVLAAIGAAAAQKGPLWWAAVHRYHHRHADKEDDVHSPGIQGIWYAHVGWVLDKNSDHGDINAVKDLACFPELRLLDRFSYVPILMLMPLTYGLGCCLAQYFPTLGTSGFQMLIWGTFVSTVMVYHGTFAINSLAHLFGGRRFQTDDTSKNNLALALLTLGEGWHNNHHRYPGSERQGFFWWEIDITHYILSGLSRLGVVWDLRTPPARIYADAAMSQYGLPAGSAEQ